MKIIQQLSLNIELNQSFVTDVKYTCKFLKDVWPSVESETIQKCWKHVGFLNGEKKLIVIQQLILVQKLILKMFFFWATVSEKRNVTNRVTLTDYIDSNLEIKDQETGVKIIAEDQNTSEDWWHSIRLQRILVIKICCRELNKIMWQLRRA